MNAAQQTQLLNESERNSESSSETEANSQLAESASSPTFLGGALRTALSGASAYEGARLTEDPKPVPSDPNDAGTGLTPASYYEGMTDEALSDMQS